MSYEGLARRYRPQTFSDVVGQQHIVQTLTRAIEKGRYAPAYLFIGGRGMGKTTMARLVAKGINCAKGPTAEPCGACTSCVEIAAGRDMDVMEIDAASNTGVDNVRDVIIQAVATAPVRGRAKVFIIDEVHMLSMGAFNALLKTLEEPPANVIFILATTEGHKVPPTIRSRCQRFDFRPITAQDLAARLAHVAKKEKIAIEPEAIQAICEYADGGVRDALSALDTVSSFAGGKITTEVIEEALGLVPSQAIEQLMEQISRGDAAGLLASMAELIATGIDPYEILRGILNAFRAQLHAVVAGKETRFSRGRIVKSLEHVIEVMDRARYARHLQLETEVLLSRLAGLAEEEVTILDVYRRLQGDDAAAAPAPAPRAAAAPTKPTARPTTPEKSEAPAKTAAKKSGIDPSIEKIKDLFNAEIVEITEEKS